jgi:hypothetical protein
LSKKTFNVIVYKQQKMEKEGKNGERRQLTGVILKEEAKKVIFKFDGVVPSHTSQIGWNKNWGI